MTINAAFDEELAEIDGTKSFSVTINGAWGENEFEVSGYSITAGTYEAAEHGAVEALYELGYRFWSTQWITRPSSLPSGGVTIARTERKMPYCSMFLNYGADDSDTFERWCVLNGCNDDRRPVGHAWGSWYLDDTAWFNANTGYWSLDGGRVVFNLADATAFEQLAQRAALWLSTRLNAYNRAAWDPPDGDELGADLVWPWAARCVAILRSTYAITDAELGVYAYGGHRDFNDVIGEDLTGVYGQVSLGFNDLGIGYPALVAGWAGVLTAGCDLRGYGDIAAQDGYRIPVGAGAPSADFSDYITNGATGMRLETSSNWAKNVLSHHVLNRLWAVGGDPAEIFDTALTEIVGNLFNNDEKVTQLFQLWASAPTVGGEGFLIQQSFEIVDQMQDASWWKGMYSQYLSIQSDLFDLYSNRSYDGEYFTLLEQAMANTRALSLENESIHAGAVTRQEAGSGATTNQGRGDLNVLATPKPHWYRYPYAATSAQIAAAKQKTNRYYSYPAVTRVPTSMSDWVELAAPDPIGAADVATADAESLSVRYLGRFIFSGPGTVTVANTSGSGTPAVTEYGSGLTLFETLGQKTLTWTGGTLYAIANPSFWYAGTDGGVTWAYVPQTLLGWHLINSGVRLSVIDADGRKDIFTRYPPFGEGTFDADPRDIVPGVVCIGTQTSGNFTLAGANPTISTDRTKLLMPYPLAQREGLV